MADDIEVTGRTLEIKQITDSGTVQVYTNDTIEVQAASNRVRLQVLVDGHVSSTYFIVSSDSEWAVPQKREVKQEGECVGELWIYVDANHSFYQRKATLTFTHLLCDSCEMRVEIRQAEETYSVAFDRESEDEEYPSTQFYPLQFADSEYTEIKDQIFDTNLTISGGSKKFRIHVTKERWVETDEETQEVVDDNEESAPAGEWLPTRVDNSVVVGDLSVETESDDTIIYKVSIIGHGLLDIEDTVRYVVNVAHVDYPLSVNDKFYVTYDKEPVQSAQIYAIGRATYRECDVLTKQKMVDYSEISHGVDIVMAEMQQGPEQAPPDDVSKLPFLVMVTGSDGSYTKIETPIGVQTITQVWDTENAYTFLLAVGPSDTAGVLFSQSSDFVVCNTELVENDVVLFDAANNKHKVSVFRITLTRAIDSYFLVDRYDKLRFASEAYPTLYLEMIVTANPSVGQWTITLAKTPHVKIRVDQDESNASSTTTVRTKHNTGDEIIVTDVTSN